MGLDEAVVAWVRSLWALKEAILTDFYAAAPGERDLAAAVARAAAAPAANGAGDRGPLVLPAPRSWPVELSGSRKAAMVASLAFWLTTTAAWAYFALKLTLLRLYFALAVATFAAVQVPRALFRSAAEMV